MNRRKWLWAALVAVPAVVAGTFAYANTQRAAGYTCPLTGERLPCPNCCPLSEQPQQAAEEGYTCPLTGETLDCPGCCPLNKK